MDDQIISTVLGVAGLLAGVIGTVYTWKSFRISKLSMDRIVDVKLWRHGVKSLEAQFILRNGGIATTLLDRIEVLRPRGVKVAWHFDKETAGAMTSLQDLHASNIHEVRLIVEPGKSGTVSMVMELPTDADFVSAIKMRARISANDLSRRNIWKAFIAKPSMATDQRPINKAILGIPEDKRP